MSGQFKMSMITSFLGMQENCELVILYQDCELQFEERRHRFCETGSNADCEWLVGWLGATGGERRERKQAASGSAVAGTKQRHTAGDCCGTI